MVRQLSNWAMAVSACSKYVTQNDQHAITVSPCVHAFLFRSMSLILKKYRIDGTRAPGRMALAFDNGSLYVVGAHKTECP